MSNIKKDLLSRVGDLSQVFGARESRICSGPGTGVRQIEVRNGRMSFTVLPDRAMDIAELSYAGVNLSYMSKTGIADSRFNSDDRHFFRTFHAGLMTTCGLRNVGSPVEDSGEYFGIHGRISNIPASEVSVVTSFEDDGTPVMNISGTVREAAFFGENIVLRRTIRTRYGSPRIEVFNTVENEGFRDEILMFLLHCNVGYPLLDACTRFIAPAVSTEPRDEDARAGADRWTYMDAPTPEYREQVFYHTLPEASDVRVGFVNPSLALGLCLSYNTADFPLLGEWKQMGQGEYVAAMEPSNCYVGGRLDPRNAGRLTVLAPFSSRHFDVCFDVLEGAEAMKLISGIS